MKPVSFILVVALLMCPLGATPARAEKDEPAGFRPALLVIDVQNQWLPGMDNKGKENSLGTINALMKFFRYHGYPVILVYHSNPKIGPEPGTEAFNFPASIEIGEGDLKITKNHPSAFQKTDLDKILKEKKCNTLFLCGLSAVGCVLATYFGAQDRDYEAFMIQGALLSHDAGYTRVVEEISNTISPPALGLLLTNVKK